jgi:hypothetical protein
MFPQRGATTFSITTSGRATLSVTIQNGIQNMKDSRHKVTSHNDPQLRNKTVVLNIAVLVIMTLSRMTLSITIKM